MGNKIGLNYDGEIDFSLLSYSPEQILGFQTAARQIEKYFFLPVNEQNFNEVITIWHELISVLPLPIILADVNFILRSRPSKELQVFEDEADISYNSKCPDLIPPGRFNRPTEAVFYGTLPSDQQEKFVSAATIESYKELISDGSTEEVLYYHLCKFTVKEPFPVMNLCFEPRVLSLHPGLDKQVRENIKTLKRNLPKESTEAIIKFWHFISNLASVRKLADQHYMVSTALFCLIREFYESRTNIPVNGLIYPSPMVYGDAVNIVLMPQSVNRYLVADDCFIFKYIRDLENKKRFETDICSKPSKVSNGKLNITNVVWGRELANYGH